MTPINTFLKRLFFLFGMIIAISSHAQNIPIVISYFPTLNKSGNLCFDRKMDYKEKWENIAKRYNINNKKLMAFNDENATFIKTKSIKVPLALNSNLFMKPNAQQGSGVYVPVYYLIKVTQKASKLSTQFKEPLLTFIKSYNKIKDHYTLNKNAPIFVGYLKVTKEFGWNFAKTSALKNYNSIDDFQAGKDVLKNAANAANATQAIVSTPSTAIEANKEIKPEIKPEIKDNKNVAIASTPKVELKTKVEAPALSINKLAKIAVAIPSENKTKQENTTKQNQLNNVAKQAPVEKDIAAYKNQQQQVNNAPNSIKSTATSTVAMGLAKPSANTLEQAKNINEVNSANILKAASNISAPLNTSRTNNEDTKLANALENKIENNKAPKVALEMTNEEVVDAKEEDAKDEIEKLKTEEKDEEKENEDIETTNVAKIENSSDKKNEVINEATNTIEPLTKNAEENIEPKVEKVKIEKAPLSEIVASIDTKTKINETKNVVANTLADKNVLKVNEKVESIKTPIIVPPTNTEIPVMNKKIDKTISFFKPEYDEEKEAGKTEEIRKCFVKVFKLMFDESDNKYYVLFSKLPPGSILKITNNDRTIFAKVISGVPSSLKKNQNEILVISDFGSKILGIKDDSEVTVSLLK